MTRPRIKVDILLIGGGAAGLSLALRLAENHSIALITKGIIEEGSSYYAQGGIAAVIDENDSIDSHIQDTLNAGAGLCDPDVVTFVVERGKQNIDWLIERGVPFTRQIADHPKSGFHLTREGGHSHRRIIHAADATGRALTTTLANQAKAHPNIHIYEQHNAVDLAMFEALDEAGRVDAGVAWPELLILLPQANWVTAKIAVWVLTCLTETATRLRFFTQITPCLLLVGPVKSICIQAIQTQQQAMELPWPGVQAAVLPTWSSTSFTQPVCSTHKQRLSC